MSALNYLLAIAITCVAVIVVVAYLMLFETGANEQKCAVSSDEMRLATARVYWVPWSSRTYSRLSTSDVEEFADLSKSVQDRRELDCLAYQLMRPEITQGRFDPDQMDVRLVVKATKLDGSELTYFADRFSVCLLETQTCRANTNDFQSWMKEFMASSKPSSG